MPFLSIIIWICLIYIQLVTCLYCVKHKSIDGGHSSLDFCKINKNRPISAAALSNKLDTITQKNNLTFDLTCKASSSDCEGVSATLSQATDIISSVFQFEVPLIINASYVSFCQAYQDCHHDSKYASIGQAYPSISYVMVDNTDKMTRLYPQPLLKQFTNMSVKPSWIQYDIEAQFNNEINWYFTNNPDPIRSDQTDFLRNVIHELIHGLGFMTSWSDDFYNDLSPLFDSGKLDHFITPTLLSQTNNQQLMSNYNTNQPFWGFVEFPFDKFIHYSSDDKYTPFSAATKQLNSFSSSNTTFRNMIDLANAWYNSDEYTYSKQMYTKAVTSLDVLAVIDNEPQLFLETSVTPFSSGSSLCHVDQSKYLNTTEYLMVYLANAGVNIVQLDLQFPQGPIGPKLLKIMASLGYKLQNNSNISTVRPSLAYWSPPNGLVGTESNPSPSLSIDTAGPARMPTSSMATASATSTSASSTDRSASASAAVRQYWSLLISCIIITAVVYI